MHEPALSFQNHASRAALFLVILPRFATVCRLAARQLTVQMNAEDFARIWEFAERGGYQGSSRWSLGSCKSIFQLPDVDIERLWMVAVRGIDWSRWMKDLMEGILGKMGSFAEDWYFHFCFEEGQIEASSPYFMVDQDNNEFKRLQKVVFRRLKLCASQRSLFYGVPWRDFRQSANMSERHGYKEREITDEDVEEAKRTGTFPSICFGKLTYLKYQANLFWEMNYLQLDDLIALHRNGRYTLPGKRINFSNLKYNDQDQDGDKTGMET